MHFAPRRAFLAAGMWTGRGEECLWNRRSKAQSQKKGNPNPKGGFAQGASSKRAKRERWPAHTDSLHGWHGWGGGWLGGLLQGFDFLLGDGVGGEGEEVADFLTGQVAPDGGDGEGAEAWGKVDQEDGVGLGDGLQELLHALDLLLWVVAAEELGKSGGLGLLDGFHGMRIPF